jgi:fructose-bisphosphate aldolase, class I
VETMESGELPTSLPDVARALVAPGKGILAADESHPTMAKRLATIGLDSSADLRLAYRELLLTSPGLSEHVSGVILFDETIRQFTHGGAPFAEALAGAGIVPASRSTAAPPRSPGSSTRSSPRASTGSGIVSSSTPPWGPGSPSGAP